MPKESARATAAFEAYQGLGPARSLEKLFRKLMGALCLNLANDAEAQREMGEDVLRLFNLSPETQTGS